MFTGGRIDSAVAASQSEADAARIGFERALLEAVAEVENAATGVVRTRERHAHLEAAVVAARDAVGLAEQLYSSGSRSLTQVIKAQRALAATEDTLLVAHQAAFIQTIALYRALGGGFEAIGLDGSVSAEATDESNQ